MLNLTRRERCLSTSAICLVRTTLAFLVHNQFSYDIHRIYDIQMILILLPMSCGCECIFHTLKANMVR